MKSSLKLFVVLQLLISFAAADFMTSTDRTVKSVSWQKATSGYYYVVIVTSDNSGVNKAFIYRSNNSYCDLDGAKAILAQALSAKATGEIVYFTSSTDFTSTTAGSIGLPPSGSSSISSWDFYSMQVGKN